jgi:hypothetical protein
LTRTEPTDAETVLRGELLKFFNGRDLEFVARTSEDKPDFLFLLSGQLVACEAVQIPPSEVFQYVHKRLHECPNDRAIGTRVTWPEEPHSWVAAAVQKKRSKIVAYKRETGAQQCWLLVHAPIEDSQVFIRGDFAWERQMLRFGASSVPSGFDRVLFWEPKSGMQFIHRHGENHRPVKFDLTNGYPSRSFTLFSAPFTTTAKGEPPRDYDYGEIEVRDIFVPPIDKQFVGLQPAGRLWRYKLRITAYDDHAEMHPEIIRVR